MHFTTNCYCVKRKVMCGITGAVYKNGLPDNARQLLESSLNCIASRGPDDEGFYQSGNVLFGHRRLSVIDISDNAHQPFSDIHNRYTLIFNGEIFNFPLLRQELLEEGHVFKSQSDTEVLLHLFIRDGIRCLNRLNGFFAFAIHDKLNDTVTLVRDRYGVKPLYFYSDDQKFLFGSEVKSILAAGIKREIDITSLHLYLQLNYVPGPWSMVKGIEQVAPGHYLELKKGQIKTGKWYHLPPIKHYDIPYEQACKQLFDKLQHAVRRRMISDVPLGAFLSGGIDSSIITALAANETNGLHTFSIGFEDEPHFDETSYARKVAAHCKTIHKEFRLKSDDLLEALPSVLDYFGEPFADSSALAVYILSRETRKYVTVALSGDGADELFAGYKKHRAEFLIRKHGRLGKLAGTLSPMLASLQGSRQSKHGNMLRQLHRFAEGSRLSKPERYWRWCSITGFSQAAVLLKDFNQSFQSTERIQQITSEIKTEDYNEVLRTDLQLVLPFDMLVKVDLMSMANSLEVRTPFLDVEVVEAALSYPASYKIDKLQQKKILKDTFGHLLPSEIFTRGKQGFEVPLQKWMKTSLKPMLDNYLSADFIKQQGIFNYDEIKKIRISLDSGNAGEATARLWALLVFQYWWKNKFHN